MRAARQQPFPSSPRSPTSTQQPSRSRLSPRRQSHRKCRPASRRSLKSLARQSRSRLVYDLSGSLGYWTRANPEQCLLATGGRPSRQAKDVRRLVVEKRREHSRKPDCVRERIERLVKGPYVELFSRETK